MLVGTALPADRAGPNVMKTMELAMTSVSGGLTPFRPTSKNPRFCSCAAEVRQQAFAPACQSSSDIRRGGREDELSSPRRAERDPCVAAHHAQAVDQHADGR